MTAEYTPYKNRNAAGEHEHREHTDAQKKAAEDSEEDMIADALSVMNEMANADSEKAKSLQMKLAGILARAKGSAKAVSMIGSLMGMVETQINARSESERVAVLERTAAFRLEMDTESKTIHDELRRKGLFSPESDAYFARRQDNVIYQVTAFDENGDIIYKDGAKAVRYFSGAELKEAHILLEGFAQYDNLSKEGQEAVNLKLHGKKTPPQTAEEIDKAEKKLREETLKRYGDAYDEAKTPEEKKEIQGRLKNALASIKNYAESSRIAAEASPDPTAQTPERIAANNATRELRDVIGADFKRIVKIGLDEPIIAYTPPAATATLQEAIENGKTKKISFDSLNNLFDNIIKADKKTDSRTASPRTADAALPAPLASNPDSGEKEAVDEQKKKLAELLEIARKPKSTAPATTVIAAPISLSEGASKELTAISERFADSQASLQIAKTPVANSNKLITTEKSSLSSAFSVAESAIPTADSEFDDAENMFKDTPLVKTVKSSNNSISAFAVAESAIPTADSEFDDAAKMFKDTPLIKTVTAKEPKEKDPSKTSQLADILASAEADFTSKFTSIPKSAKPANGTSRV